MFFKFHFNEKKAVFVEPWELNDEGGGFALILRYCGCQLRCPLCYARRYAWFSEDCKLHHADWVMKQLSNIERALRVKVVKRKPRKITWVRIQGGELCLNFERTMATIDFAAALTVIRKYNVGKFYVSRAIIQTNGVFFSRIDEKMFRKIENKLIDVLKRIENHDRIIFEISFKTPVNKVTMWNPKAFSMTLKAQVAGFKKLLGIVKNI
ncbi:MAG: hypothetical protein B6U76_03290 [Desulfurococcales archaeon ex4484_217_2]|nr:MAG: hypothetical protein B6U76_03290 [Desulfurococcales archaeon ex4484_217_2]